MHKNIIIQNAKKIKLADPTRTTTLRNAFANDAKRRFSKISKEITLLVDTNDSFGLKEQVFTNVTSPRSFSFMTDDQKIVAFLAWIRSQIEKNIFDGYAGPEVTDAFWSNLYVRRAYDKGLERAYSELNKTGQLGSISSFSSLPKESIVASLGATPINIERARSLYTRVFENLKGITASMSSEMARVLGDGFLKGDNPKVIAKALNSTVSKIGKNRSILLARTEVIRAHHLANIQTYRQAGLQGVKVRAEWSTAGDSRVCAKCASLEGIIFDLDTIENMIPLHPLCRCVAIPIIKE